MNIIEKIDLYLGEKKESEEERIASADAQIAKMKKKYPPIVGGKKKKKKGKGKKGFDKGFNPKKQSYYD
jgi:hypothetical protein